MKNLWFIFKWVPYIYPQICEVPRMTLSLTSSWFGKPNSFVYRRTHDSKLFGLYIVLHSWMFQCSMSLICHVSFFLQWFYLFFMKAFSHWLRVNIYGQIWYVSHVSYTRKMGENKIVKHWLVGMFMINFL